MQSKAATVPEYLAELEPDRRAALERLRATVRRVAPEAQELMTYGMPTYVLGGAPFVAFASQKQYVAFYADPPVVARHRASLGTADCGKSCIRYRDPSKIPLDALDAMIRESAAEWRARAARGDTSTPASHAMGGSSPKKSAAKKTATKKTATKKTATKKTSAKPVVSAANRKAAGKRAR